MRRRDFLRWSGLVGVGLAFRPGFAWAQVAPQGVQLRKFIQPLPGLGPSGIPLATKDTTKYPGSDFYDLEAAQYYHQFHPDLLPSKLWGYADLNGPHGYLGGVIVAQKGRPVRLRMHNKLPSRHPLPVDTSIAGANLPPNRIAVHLHGGLVPWNSDGGPFAWFGPGNAHGESFANPGPLPGTADYYYPNDQSARLVWYHDHAMGITRLNAYAGLASAYVITDAFEQDLIASQVLPDIGIPLVLQEKAFVNGRDPKYIWGQKGDLFYPYKYDAEYGPDQAPSATVTGPLPVPSCVPEFFGDQSIVNGAAYPFLTLQRRHYRFRILNGAQARFFNLQLYYADASGYAADLSRPGPAIVQIGTEGGFLPAPVRLNEPPQPLVLDPVTGNALKYNLLLAPAERADVLVDFSGVPSGSKLILYNDAPAPFPGGDEPVPGPSTDAALSPDTRNLMQFQVIGGAVSEPRSLDTLFKPGNHVLPPIPALNPAQAVQVRNLTLNEDYDEFGRLIQRLGTASSRSLNSQGLSTWALNYMDDPTETPKAGTVEVWNIFNLTGDTHPIHFHLVNVQVLSRRPFDLANWNGTPAWTGKARSPDANERGFKETVRMDPGECTTVIMKFDLPNVPFEVPMSPRTGGHEYVWHCHILEHEEHDMMRPLVVRP